MAAVFSGLWFVNLCSKLYTVLTITGQHVRNTKTNKSKMLLKQVAGTTSVYALSAY
jgi:hypothetical protein